MSIGIKCIGIAQSVRDESSEPCPAASAATFSHDGRRLFGEDLT